jgi:hypothetical protein
VSKAKVAAEKETGEKKDSVAALAEFNRTRFGTIKGVVDSYLKKCIPLSLSTRRTCGLDSLLHDLGGPSSGVHKRWSAVYFAGLWDVEKAKVAAEKETGEKKDSVAALAEFNRTRFGTA